MEKVVGWILKYPKLVLILIGAITLTSLALLPALHFDSNYINMLPPTEEHLTLRRDVLKEQQQGGGDLFVLIQGERVYHPESLNTIQAVLHQLDSLEIVDQTLSPFEFITVQKKGSRLSTLPLSPLKAGQSFDDESAALFKERLFSDRMARSLFSNPQRESLLFVITPTDISDEISSALDEIEAQLSPLSEWGTLSFIGTPLFERQVLRYLTVDLRRLLTLSLAIIVLLFYLAFRSKRAVTIPFSLSLIALIWTLAVMVLLKYHLSVVNVVVPSMVLILGTSYSIHVLNEYFRGIGSADTTHLITTAITRISKTIFGASITTIVGFLSLLSCRMDAFKELGLSVSLGIFFCSILSLTYIPALLSLLSDPRPKQSRQRTRTAIQRTLHRMSFTLTRRWALALVLLVVITIGFLLTNKQVRIETDYFTYFPKGDTLIAEATEFAKQIGGSDPHYITLTHPDAEYFLTPEALERVFAFEENLIEHNSDITHLLSFSRYVAFLSEVYSGEYAIPETRGLLLLLSRMLTAMAKQIDNPWLSSLISEDGSRMTISVRSWDSRYESWESLESIQTLQDQIKEARSILDEEIEIVDWGIGVDALRMGHTIKLDQDRSLILSLILVFLFVVIHFRSPVIGLFSLIPTLVGIMGNYLFMHLLSIPFDVITIIFASITVGVGVDGAIHFLIRFTRRKEERPHLPYGVLIAQTLEETAQPILLASLSLVLGLLALLFASFLPARYFGLLLSFALLVTSVATLFILPAVMIGYDRVKQVVARRRDRSR